MLAGVIQMGAVIAVVTSLTIDLYLPGGLIEGTGDLATARTEAFTVLVFAQLFNCLNARSETTSAFAHPFVNPWLGARCHVDVAAGGGRQPGFPQPRLRHDAAELDQWLLCAAMASLVLWFSELRKVVSRVLGRRSTSPPPAELNASP